MRSPLLGPKVRPGPFGFALLLLVGGWSPTSEPEGSRHWTGEGSFRARALRDESVGERLAAPGTGSLSGRVVASEGGEPISGAEVELKELGRRSFSDGDGRFSFRFLPPGAVMLNVSQLGYADAKGVVQILEGEIVEVEVRLAVEPFRSSATSR